MATTVFEDDFTGPAYGLPSHTPNIAPSGFAYGSNSPFDNLQISGDGSVLAGTGGGYVSNSSVGTWTPATLEFPVTMTLAATAVGITDAESSITSSLFYIEDTTGDNFLEISIEQVTTTVFNVVVRTFDTTVSTAVSALGAHLYQVVFTATGYSLLFDGAEIDTQTVDLSALTSLAFVTIAVTSGLDFFENLNSIQLVSVTFTPATPVGTRHAYAIDMKPTGFGVIPLGFHANAGYVDPIGDTMYLALDSDVEPDDPSLPIPPTTPPYIDGKTIYEFEGSDTDLMTYRWKGKLWLLERPSVMLMAQVKAEDYNNLLLRVYGDGVQIDEVVITQETEFTLVTVDQYTTLQIELLGTSTVRSVQVVEDVQELT